MHARVPRGNHAPLSLSQMSSHDARASAPLPLLSPQAEFDRKLLRSNTISDAIRADGSWDQGVSLAALRDTILLCLGWWTVHATANLLNGAARAKFTSLLKAKFVECLLLQDFEYFERHGVRRCCAPPPPTRPLHLYGKSIALAPRIPSSL